MNITCSTNRKICPQVPLPVSLTDCPCEAFKIGAYGIRGLFFLHIIYPLQLNVYLPFFQVLTIFPPSKENNRKNCSPRRKGGPQPTVFSVSGTCGFNSKSTFRCANACAVGNGPLSCPRRSPGPKAAQAVQ